MEGLEYLKELYKKAYENGDEAICEKVMESMRKAGIVPSEDKLDVMNRMKGKSKRCVM